MGLKIVLERPEMNPFFENRDPKSVKVAVGMSGGVDSAVSALLLKQAGYDVFGLFMKNWEDKDGSCPWESEVEDVARACGKIGIPYYTVDFVQEYWDSVFSDFLSDLNAGFTPNPDVLCNREIKFKVFYQKAKALGADVLATGHYCRVGKDEAGNPTLLKGLDPLKDQSYFLHAIEGSVLQDVLFPIGDIPKKQVKEIARDSGLDLHTKKESTGICFIGERKFNDFLGQYLKAETGPFKTLDGKTVGKHQGIPFYTIGQRKGLGLGGQGEPWFVVGKSKSENTVWVHRGEETGALLSDGLTANSPTWIGEKLTQSDIPFECEAKIRYRQPSQPCVITQLSGGYLEVQFKTPQRAITPRQAVVFYRGDVCLGGAVIDKATPSYHELGKSPPVAHVLEGKT